jgi:enoyl-CoA hydratase
VSEPALLYEKSGHIATLTMNRPEVRNAINPEMLCRFADAWEDVNNDVNDPRRDPHRGRRAGVLRRRRSRQARAHAAGRDPGRERIRRADQERRRHHLQGLDAEPRRVQADRRGGEGFCVAGGLEILNCCDIRVAAEDAQFGLAEVKWSLFPMGGSTVRIPRQIPWPIAMELMLTGERISAPEAYRVCLINKVVPASQVMAEARRYADIIAANGPLAVQAVKRSALTGLGMETAKALEKEMEIGIPVSMSEDAREGPKAFKEKRTPTFKGR